MGSERSRLLSVIQEEGEEEEEEAEEAADLEDMQSAEARPPQLGSGEVLRNRKRLQATGTNAS